MSVPLAATVELCDEGEGWFPLSSARLLGTVIYVMPGDKDENPLYVVELREPVQVPQGSRLPAGVYPSVVIKSRWRGFDVHAGSSVSVHVVLPPSGAVEEGRARLTQLPVAVWAGCRQVSGEA